MKEKYYSRLGIGLLVIVLVLICSIRSSAQIVVTEFNACWNKENTTEWLDSLQNCYLTKVEMDRIGKRKLQKIHNVTIVPTLIIFQDGIEVKRYIADISFTIPATREEVQLFINEIY
jgi:type IV secretory pathway component VirB8|tara:strand:- start:663 stop:1013 length:351 start_codon:yes stop_codon:yes gene_type:complete